MDTSTADLAQSFVSSYYKTFVHQRGDLYKFYTSKGSTLSHSTGVKQEVFTGPNEIKDFVAEHYGDVQVRLADRVIVDSQASADGGHMVVVVGKIGFGSSPMVWFTQSFLLRPFRIKEMTNFYVHNDVLRIVPVDPSVTESVTAALEGGRAGELVEQDDEVIEPEPQQVDVPVAETLPVPEEPKAAPTPTMNGDVAPNPEAAEPKAKAQPASGNVRSPEKRGKGGKSSRSRKSEKGKQQQAEQPQQQAEKPKGKEAEAEKAMPKSWASLVGGSAVPAESPKPTKERRSKDSTPKGRSSSKIIMVTGLQNNQELEPIFKALEGTFGKIRRPNFTVANRAAAPIEFEEYQAAAAALSAGKVKAEDQEFRIERRRPNPRKDRSREGRGRKSTPPPADQENRKESDDGFKKVSHRSHGRGRGRGGRGRGRGGRGGSTPRATQ